MLITFRETADLSLQIALAVAVVVCGTSLATVAANSEPKPRQVIDVGRPVLWDPTPVRVDRQEHLLTITVRPPASQAAAAICSDAIGLRIACDLVSNRRPS